MGVEAALARLMGRKQPLSGDAVEEELRQDETTTTATGVTVGAVDLSQYDGLLEGKEAEDGEG